jgi:hypothetical protein
METGKSKLENKNLKIETGNWKAETGKRELEDIANTALAAKPVREIGAGTAARNMERRNLRVSSFHFLFSIFSGPIFQFPFSVFHSLTFRFSVSIF